jgi:hypothetical protein
MVNGQITLIGVISAGSEGCEGYLPVILARISKALPWIRQTSDVNNWKCQKQEGRRQKYF